MTRHPCIRTSLPLTLVVAMTAEGVIGNQGKLPWNLPEELRLFRQLTLGGTVIMGRKTFESLPAPLEERHNLVVGQPNSPPDRCETYSTPELAIDRAQQLNRPIFVIGGRNIYRSTLPVCDQLVVSWIERPATGDIFFPDIEWSQWEKYKEEKHVGFRRCFYRRGKSGI